MLFVCYPKCGTCKKAQKWLDENGIAYEYRNIKTEKPSREELEEWLLKSGLPVKKLWNTSGIQYRALNLKERLKTMPEAEQLELLSTDGMLVKRPVLEGGDFVLVGFDEKTWKEIFNV